MLSIVTVKKSGIPIIIYIRPANTCLLLFCKMSAYVDVAPYTYRFRSSPAPYEDFMELKYIVEIKDGKPKYTGPDLFHYSTKTEAQFILKSSFRILGTTVDSVDQILIGGQVYAVPTDNFKLTSNIIKSIFPPNYAKQAEKEKLAEYYFKIPKNVVQKFVKDGGHVYCSDTNRKNYILTKRRLH